MSYKNFAGVAGTVFGIVAIVQALRFINGWPVQIGSFTVPLWFSALAALFAGYMALQGFRLKK